MEIKRVINIEDNSFKYIAIKRALEKNGVITVEKAGNAEEGFAKIEQAVQEQNPYDLLITDMHFPAKGEVDPKAGMYVIEELKRRGNNIPIVICSTRKYIVDGVEESIVYNERSRDVDGDIREMLRKLRQK